MDAKASGKIKKHWLALADRDWLAFDRVDYLGAKIILGIAVAGSILSTTRPVASPTEPA